MNIFNAPLDIPGTISPQEAGIPADIREIVEMFLRLLNAPRGTPAISAVLTTVSHAVSCVFSRLPTPTDTSIQLCERLKTLAHALKSAPSNGNVEAPNALKGMKHKHPMWCLCAQMGTSNNQLASVYAGLQILVAIARNKPVPASGTRHLSILLGEEDVPEKTIDILLTGNASETTVDAPWLHSLHKLWREVIRAYSLEPSPPPSPRGRVVSDLMNNLFSGSSAQHAGATKHRNQSKRQVKNSLATIRAELEMDTLHGALGVIVCITGLSVEVVANLEILDRVIDGAWPAGISIAEGLIKINLELIVNEPSRALRGCIPSSYVLVRPLPKILAEHLKTRLTQHQDTRTLRDLYPGHTVPKNVDLVYQSPDEIQPTWSRLRFSAGQVARQSGLDCMSTFLVSCDLNHIPRSKLHYACVNHEEISEAMQSLYSLAGWGDPEPLTANLLGFGCRAVPTPESLHSHDIRLVKCCDELRPGNHAGLHRLLAFHNSFVRLSAWRIAVLLALRESMHLNLSAAIDEQNSTWVALHDKFTPNDQGPQPVPLCKFVRSTIAAIRVHCRDMHARLSRQHTSSSNFARWCGSVSRGTDIRLLCLATETFKVVPVGTRDFTCSFTTEYELPPDVGRKVMENHLRHVGLPSTLIDAVLRHSIRGQYRLSAFSNSCLDSWSQRTARAMDTVATSLFGDVIYGLSKE